MTTKLTVKQMLDHLPSISTSDLYSLLKAINNEIPKRKGKTSSYTHYIEDFCTDEELLGSIWKECEDLDISSDKPNCTGSQWLSCNDNPYIFNDTNPVHQAKDINTFPNINKLLSIVNECTEVTGPLDSCLITKYSNNKASLRLHSDDEDTQIDQKKSICSFSLGCERTIEFWGKGRNPKKVNSYRMHHNSLIVMRPGCQQNLKHTVRPDPQKRNITATVESSDSHSSVRYSLSFRAVAKSSTVIAPSDVKIQETNHQDANLKSEDTITHTHTPKRVCLIAGDSYASRMKSNLLSKGKINVDNIAIGGAKIDKVKKNLEDYRVANPGYQVEKVIISVGTNDIRHAKDGIDHLRGPLKSLCSTVQKLYPNSTVFFQSLLPLPLKHPKDWEANRWVMGFNKALHNECKFRKFYLIDAFYPFCNFRKKYNEPFSRFNPLFEENGIHPNEEKGMGILARKYIFALHKFRKHFNPLIYQ